MNTEELKYRIAVRSEDIMTEAERKVIRFAKNNMQDYPDISAALAAIAGGSVQVFTVPGAATDFVRKYRRDISEMLGHECQVSGLSPKDLLANCGELPENDPLFAEPRSMIVLAKWAMSTAASSLLYWLVNVSEKDDPSYREAEHAADMLNSLTDPKATDDLRSVIFDWKNGRVLAGSPLAMASVEAPREFLQLIWKFLTTSPLPDADLSAIAATGTPTVSLGYVDQVRETLSWEDTTDSDPRPLMDTLSVWGKVMVENAVEMFPEITWKTCTFGEGNRESGVSSTFITENAQYRLKARAVK